MKKIPTLFRRDPANRATVIPEVTPGCEWVLAGEGVATRKYDGTAVLIRDLIMYKRREAPFGRPLPPGFVLADTDDNTGKRVGWVPVDPSSPEDRWHVEAFTRPLARFSDSDPAVPVVEPISWPDGTYELVGPKVQGNPENFPSHTLIRHADAPVFPTAPRDYGGLYAFLTDPSFTHEGLVWHHPDGRMAKLKHRDFPRPRD